MLVIRHLYGRPLDSLLATWGIGLILIATARYAFGDTLTFSPPHWMEGGVEVAADLVFPRNRVFIICFCVVCIALVYFLVNWTKLGLLLRATTQNREMAAALGVATRRVDGLTFALGAGLAGLAGVVVPFYNKINPNIGQEYIVDSFMVVVTGGVGKLAGAIWSGPGPGLLQQISRADSRSDSLAGQRRIGHRQGASSWCWWCFSCNGGLRACSRRRDGCPMPDELLRPGCRAAERLDAARRAASSLKAFQASQTFVARLPHRDVIICGSSRSCPADSLFRSSFPF